MSAMSVASSWPFPEDPKAPPPNPGAGFGWDVFDETGKYLSSITTFPTINRLIALVGEPRALRIIAIHSDIGRVVVVRL